MTAVQIEAFYLQEAANLGQKGSVSLCFKVRNNGDLDQVVIERGTGYPLLDGAALYAAGLIARGVSRQDDAKGSAQRKRNLLHPPKEVLDDQDAVWLRLRVNFQLVDEAPGEPMPAVALKHGGSVDPGACKILEPQGQEDIAVSRALEESFNQYGKIVRDALHKVLLYPRFLFRQGLGGNTQLRYIIRRDGSLICASVDRTSGYAALDGAALISLGLVFASNAVSSAAPLPDSELEVVSFFLPINFVFDKRD